MAFNFVIVRMDFPLQVTMEFSHVFFQNLFFWPHYVACWILVPQPGIEPVLPAVEAWSPNHWTASEVT